MMQFQLVFASARHLVSQSCMSTFAATVGNCIAVFPILPDAVDVKRGDQLCEKIYQPSIQPDKLVRPMGS